MGARLTSWAICILAGAVFAAGCSGPQPTRSQPPEIGGTPAARTDALTPRQVCRRRLRLPTLPEAPLDFSRWQLGSAAVEDGLRLNYRVPQGWDVTASGRAELGERLVDVTAEATRVTPSVDQPLFLYATELAGATGTLYRTAVPGPTRELPGYVSERRVSLAPDPEAGAYDVHSLVLPGLEHALKLEVRYRSTNAWRYRDAARTIISSAHVVRLPEPGAEPDADPTPEPVIELPSDRCITGPNPGPESPRPRVLDRDRATTDRS